MIDTEINWRGVDTLLVDMDGTVLDLAFDNYFWTELLPQHYAGKENISLNAAQERIQAHNSKVLGTLQWYCIEHWSDWLDLNVAEIKHSTRHRIAYLPGALEFLRRAKCVFRHVAILTNAHPRTLAIKLGQTHLDRHVDAVFNSHDIGHPKESAQFWQRFEREQNLARERTVMIDDSAAVVAAARSYGLAGVVRITRPDSGQPHSETGEQAAISSLTDLSLTNLSPKEAGS